MELARPVGALRPGDGGGRWVRVLVRLHGRPLGAVDVDTQSGTVDGSRLAAAIWDRLREPIFRHLAADGDAGHDCIPPRGFGWPEQLACSWRSRLPSPHPTAALVVNTCGAREALVRTIRSALEQDYDNFELLVVDNRPETSSVRDLLRDPIFPGRHVRYVPEARPGLARARNAGLNAAEADVVAFTDDDVILDRSWLSSLVAALTSTDRSACVTGLILPAALDTPAQVWLEEFGGFGKGFDMRLWDRDQHRLNHPLYPYTVGIFGSGASAAFNRQVLVQLGGFDIHLGAGTPARGGEDLDVHTRVVLAGYRLVYEPAALLWHQHVRDLSGLQRQIWSYGVGLSAMLTKHLTDRQTRSGLLRRLPSGLGFAFGPRSPKHAKKSTDYPLRLSLVEYAGMAYGPLGYIRSRLSG